MVEMGLAVYFSPFLCLFLIHAATLAGMLIQSTAVPFDQLLGRQRQSWNRWYGCLGGQLPLAQGGDREQMLTRGEADHYGTGMGNGIQTGLQRDGVRERAEGMSSTRQETERAGAKRNQEQSQILFLLLL